ncbi:MAG: stage III sporulation protein AF [Oscillospiraceae bacterium]|nr:stage III sporulation protein AF [Oscillospiraceae bacterium]
MLEGIKQWAFMLVITAVVGGIANSFVISESGSMKKYVKFACSAVALMIMIMPIKEIFKEMPDLFSFYNINAPAEPENYEYYDYTENINQINNLTMTKTIELLKIRINDIVYEKTGIKPGYVYIYIRQNDNPDISIEKVILDMPENIDDSKNNKIEEVKLYLKQLFNCEVDIVDKTGEINE